MVLVTSTNLCLAQGPIGKGGAQLNAGVGLSNWGIPLYIGLDFGIHKDVTFGFEASFRSYNDRYNDYKYKHSIIGISGNFNYHFNSLLNISPKWDVYAGLNLGFYYWNSPNNYYGEHYSGLGLGGQIGVRYFLTNNVGLNLEFGGGNAFSQGKFGITIKI